MKHVGNFEIRRIEQGPLHVACHVTERWLQFSEDPMWDENEEDLLVHLDVMTRGQDGQPRQLCDLVLAQGDVLRAMETLHRESGERPSSR